ncbi:hypothetical protein LP316_11925 [Thalassotalea sp. LPB0316]|uniref:hypothetical protein n=1 Tax=Thalassotalea sp. LPB0316 TaxID=2769490 RepID=UPI0018669B14|nr:hypothetical protein [Thalassotalea sp. LPB0316]QOL25009.1 hypothetical protein LP316_11925 [Thalassotalea sp. LPB0316]
MSITIHSSSAVQTASGDALEIAVAKKAQNQQEIEGQMAVQLIEAAASSLDSLPAPTASSGNNVNIKV